MNDPERNQTDDLLRALREADALDNFQALPLEEQDRFWNWIAKSRDEEGYWRRIEILVLGMRMAPPIKAPREPRAQSAFGAIPSPDRGASGDEFSALSVSTLQDVHLARRGRC